MLYLLLEVSVSIVSYSLATLKLFEAGSITEKKKKKKIINPLKILVGSCQEKKN